MRKHLRPIFVSALLLWAWTGILAQHTGPATLEGTSTLVGKVLAANGKKPVAGARVLAYHLSSERQFTSKPTTGNGKFELAGLPFGYFDLAVETSDGLFVADQVVNLTPATKTGIVFTVRPFPARAAEGRPYPGSESPPNGMARVRQRTSGRDFWRSPRGVAVIAGLGGVALLSIAGGADNEPVATPVEPAP